MEKILFFFWRTMYWVLFMKRIELYGDGIGAVELVDYMGSDLTIVNSARVSFGKQKNELDEKDEKLINYLVKHRHTSTFEHNIATFRFVVPLFIRSQHHRHRTWSYNEISRRYTDVDMRFYEPSSFRTQHKSNRQASNDQTINPTVGFINVPIGASSTASNLVKLHNERSITYVCSCNIINLQLLSNLINSPSPCRSTKSNKFPRLRILHILHIN